MKKTLFLNSAFFLYLIKSENKKTQATLEYLAFRKSVQNQGFLIKELSDPNFQAPNQLTANDYMLNGFPDREVSRAINDHQYLIQNGFPAEYLPLRIDFTDWLKSPTFPVVLKDKSFHWGINKFLIEKPSQVQKIKLFYQNHRLELQKKIAQKTLIVEKFIHQQPSLTSSYRLIIDCSGQILSATLSYNTSPKTVLTQATLKISPRAPKKNPFAPFYKTTSPYFLKSPKILSNLCQGCRFIALQKHPLNPISPAEKIILQKHSLDPQELTIPKNLKKIARILGQKIIKKHDLLVGADFIQDSFGRFFLLESDLAPDLTSDSEKIYALANQKPVPLPGPLTLKIFFYQKALKNLT